MLIHRGIRSSLVHTTNTQAKIFIRKYKTRLDMNSMISTRYRKALQRHSKTIAT